MAISKRKPFKGSVAKTKRTTSRTKPANKGRSFRVVPLKANIVEQPPESSLTRKGLSLRQLLRTTPHMRVDTGKNEVTIKRFKKKSTKTGLQALTAIANHKDPFLPNKTVRDREVYIIGLDSQTKPVTKQKRVLVSCNCVTGDTRVLTMGGWKTIYEIAEGEGAPVSLSRQSYNINGKFYSGSSPYYKGNQKVYKLTLSNGKSIKATADHKFLVAVPGGKKNKWVQLKNLTTEHRLLLNTDKMDSFNNPDLQPPKDIADSSYHIGLFMGLMMGDGSFTDKNKTHPELRLFGEKVSLLNLLYDTGLIKDETPIENGVRVTFYRHKVLEVFHQNGYQHKKGINPGYSTDFLGYLAGLIASDGRVFKNGDIDISGSRDYLEPLLEECFRYGLHSSRLKVYPSEKKGTKTNFGKRNEDLCHLTISAVNTLPILEKLVVREDQYDKVDQSRELRPIKPSVGIESITYAGIQPVYDITVPGPTRFVVDGNVFAHNCEDFVFHGGEYACALHGAAKIIYGNGEPPTHTNPSNVPFLCKHLVGFAYYCMEKGL